MTAPTGEVAVVTGASRGIGNHGWSDLLRVGDDDCLTDEFVFHG